MDGGRNEPCALPCPGAGSALCSSHHGHGRVDPWDRSARGTFWLPLTGPYAWWAMMTDGRPVFGDAPSSPGDAHLGTCCRQGYLLLLPSRIPARPSPQPLLPNKLLSSHSCFLRRCKYHDSFFPKKLHRGDGAFHFQINPLDFFFFSPCCCQSGCNNNN